MLVFSMVFEHAIPPMLGIVNTLHLDAESETDVGSSK